MSYKPSDRAKVRQMSAQSDSQMRARLIQPPRCAPYSCLARRMRGNTDKGLPMNRTSQLALLVAAVAATVSLTACNRPGQESVGQKVDGSIAEIKSATKELGADASAAAQDAKAATAKAAGDMSGTAKDIAITAKINAALAADDKLSALRIDVDTKDGRVTINGTAPDAASRDRAKTLAAAVDGVVAVDNRLSVGKKS